MIKLTSAVVLTAVTLKIQFKVIKTKPEVNDRHEIGSIYTTYLYKYIVHISSVCVW